MTVTDGRGVLAAPELRVEFDRLFVEERQAMARLAFLMVGSEACAEEIVQDAYAKVFERWNRITQHGGYLRQCVVNGCRSHLRRRLIERRHQGEIGPATSEAPADDLLEALAVLSPKRRAAVILRYYEDLTQEEIARVLGVRVGTVKSMIHRSLKDLREVIEREQ